MEYLLNKKPMQMPFKHWHPVGLCRYNISYIKQNKNDVFFGNTESRNIIFVYVFKTNFNSNNKPHRQSFKLYLSFISD